MSILAARYQSNSPRALNGCPRSWIGLALLAASVAGLQRLEQLDGVARVYLGFDQAFSGAPRKAPSRRYRRHRARFPSRPTPSQKPSKLRLRTSNGLRQSTGTRTGDAQFSSQSTGGSPSAPEPITFTAARSSAFLSSPYPHSPNDQPLSAVIVMLAMHPGMAARDDYSGCATRFATARGAGSALLILPPHRPHPRSARHALMSRRSSAFLSAHTQLAERPAAFGGEIMSGWRMLVLRPRLVVLRLALLRFVPVDRKLGQDLERGALAGAAADLLAGRAAAPAAACCRCCRGTPRRGARSNPRLPIRHIR